ncbi:site-2 protease family protein [Roseospirillum parvum]|uniref:Zn-dependent protease (Includes SpoIVFB) n=1 Tax=Roseospirillum parvum TaxID=83401 RepID=A0A1G7YJ09_9PROT|nr:site-2 protease family protein [Roseospirillum parvum]SDG96219.1 Zn-dependent protease (includes SpoIVFB) [Roseospirillum parvum]
MFDGIDLYVVSTWVLPVLLAITFHEAAHGFVAWRLGDPTAHKLGRISANPLRHVDPMGTVILPGLLVLAKAPFIFGWAKPVPIDPRRLRQPRRDMVLVAAAGPGSNLLMALIAGLLAHLLFLAPPEAAKWLGDNLFNAMVINLVLAVFNMIPLPPLDGGRVAVGLLPLGLARPLARLERYGIFILIGALLLLPMIGEAAGLDINPVGAVVLPVVRALMQGMMLLTGHGW